MHPHSRFPDVPGTSPSFLANSPSLLGRSPCCPSRTQRHLPPGRRTSAGWCAGLILRPCPRLRHAAAPRWPDPSPRQPQELSRTRPSGEKCTGWLCPFGRARDVNRKQSARRDRTARSNRDTHLSYSQPFPSVPLLENSLRIASRASNPEAHPRGGISDRLSKLRHSESLLNDLSAIVPLQGPAPNVR